MNKKAGRLLALPLLLLGCSHPTTSTDPGLPTPAPSSSTPSPSPAETPSPTPSGITLTPSPTPTPMVVQALVKTFAGTGTASSWGDGGPASEADLKGPAGIASDGIGNVYFVDYQSHRIKKIDTSGTLWNAVGMGAQGFSGDDGPAQDAQLSYPFGVSVQGNELWIADYGNARIRKVDGDGIIRTIAGGGIEQGEGVPANTYALSGPTQVIPGPDGVYIADFTGHRILKVVNGNVVFVAGNGTAGFSGDNGPAKDAQLNQPCSIAFDGGSLYIADYGNHRIRKVDSAGTITTVAGVSAFGSTGDGGWAKDAQLNSPAGITSDGKGTLYVADTGNNRIRKIKDGRIWAYAGNGFQGFLESDDALTAQFDSPLAVAVAPGGKLLVSDYQNHRLRVVIPY